jgi:RNA polymerase sigma-70 factor (ECF subfamily)
MIERSDIGPSTAQMMPTDTADAVSQADAWFKREIVPLEGSLMRFLQYNWRNESEALDFRQEIYVRVYEAAKKQIPESPKQFLFTTARNLLTDRMRQARVVPLDTSTNLDAVEIEGEAPGPDRIVMARDELRRVQTALDQIQPRWREAIILGRIEGLSRKEIAQRMGVSDGTVAQYLTHGICALVDLLYLHSSDRRGPK